jgi:hypothetical protein
LKLQRFDALFQQWLIACFHPASDLLLEQLHILVGNARVNGGRRLK